MVSFQDRFFFYFIHEKSGFKTGAFFIFSSLIETINFKLNDKLGLNELLRNK